MKNAAIICYDWPTENGGYNKSISSCIEQYKGHFKITVFVFSDHYEEVKISDVDIIHVNIRKRDQFRYFVKSLFKSTPATELRYFEAYPTFKEICERYKFDLVICQGVLLGRAVNYLENIKKSVLMSHDCYQKAFDGIWKTKRFPISLAWYLEERKLKNFEKSIVSLYDELFAITENDRVFYKKAGMTTNGIFHRFPVIQLANKNPNGYKILSSISLLTIGRVDDRKEVGINNFLSGQFQRLKVDFPKLQYNLIGKYTEKYRNPQIGVFGHGFLENFEKFYSKDTIFLNLQEIGAGVQFKTIDALSRRMIVVCSEQSRLGLPVRLRRFVHSYSTSDELDRILRKLLVDQDYYSGALEALNELVEGDFKNDQMLMNNREILQRLAQS